MLLPVHIAAGGLALVLGAVALLAKKGGTIHRRTGLLFVCAMIVMGMTASMLGFLKSPTDGNVFAGFMTAYFVGTALTTVRPATPWTRGFNVAALIVAVGLGLGDIAAGIEAFNSPGRVRNGVPFLMLFFIATVMILAARRPHHAIWHAARRSAPGTPSVAHVLRAVHRGRIVLLGP